MAHAAEIDSNGIVLRVLVFDNSIEPNVEQFATELFGGTWIQTSYNGNFRKNFAAIGYHYDSVADVFYPPQPFPSWSLDDNHDWQAPVAKPKDEKFYTWAEDELNWIEVAND